jgi:hypothetical protein
MIKQITEGMEMIKKLINNKNHFLITLTLWTLSQGAFSATFDDPRLFYPESIWKINNQSFRLCRIDTNNAKPIFKKKKIKVHFDENSDVVKEKDVKRLVHFITHLPNHLHSVNFAGHADQCGKAEENKELSMRRVNATWDVVKDKFPRYVGLSGEANGEEESHDHSRHDKFVEITAKYAPPTTFSQIVILDISGSLDRRNIGRTETGYTVEGLKQFKFKKGSMVYVARDINQSCEGTSLGEYHPVGEDFYNQAMLLLTSKLKGKTKGFVFTDYTDKPQINKETTKQLQDKKLNGKVLWHIL